MAELDFKDIGLKDNFFILLNETNEIKSVELLGKISYVVRGKFPSHFIFPKDMYYAIDNTDKSIIPCLEIHKYFKTKEDLELYLNS